MERGDYQAAVAILQKAAQQPNPPTAVLFNLGLAYQNGRGVARDFTQAASWYLKAAVRGDAEAQYNLGVLYANGTGVVRSAANAARWYRKAALQGYHPAQYNLGVLYASGDGVAESKVLAYMWWLIAASYEGDPKEHAERHLPQLAASMTQEDVQHANDLARQCMASNYLRCG